MPGESLKTTIYVDTPEELAMDGMALSWACPGTTATSNKKIRNIDIIGLKVLDINVN